MESKPKIYIVIYTLYHHMYKLATKVAEGAEANGCQVKLFQVEETLSTEILEKMHAPAKPDLPIITAHQLAEADGIIFGLPTRFGSCPAQMKRLLDATGSLWAKGTLSQKFAGFFFSTASSHGGQETTALTAVTYLAHHGINYVPFGFASATMFDNSKVIAGSAYGAGTISNGDGSRVPIQEELDMAQTQGENFAKILATYHRGLKKSVAGLENKPIHANSQTPTDTSTGTTRAPEIEAGATAGAIAAAAGGAGLVAAGTKAAQESDKAAKQRAPTQPISTATGDEAAAQSGPAAKQGVATQGEPTTKQGASIQSDSANRLSEPAAKQGTAALSEPTVQHTVPPSSESAAKQSGPAAKQGVATQQVAQGGTTTTPKTGASAPESVPDSSTQPPNRPLTPQQEQAQAAAQPAQHAPKEKKKSKAFWFCCGNSKDLD